MNRDDMFESEGSELAGDAHGRWLRFQKGVRHTEPLNEAVRAHELTMAVDEWDYREEAALFHEWFDIFNEQLFGPRLPRPFLRIERLRSSRIGQYRRHRNGVGAAHEITINEHHLGLPEGELLACLLHEMVHEWQELYGMPGQGRYHNEEFVRKCRTVGIFVERGRGHHVGYGEPLVGLLEEHGIPFEPLFAVGEVLPRTGNLGSSKLKKWTCECTTLRAAVPVVAVCFECFHWFHEER